MVVGNKTFVLSTRFKERLNFRDFNGDFSESDTNFYRPITFFFFNQENDKNSCPR